MQPEAHQPGPARRGKSKGELHAATTRLLAAIDAWQRENEYRGLPAEVVDAYNDAAEATGREKLVAYQEP